MTTSALSPFDTAVAELVRLGFPRDKATQAIRQQKPWLEGPAAAIQAALERDASINEKREQVEIRKLFIAYGFKVYNLSQARASKQTPGLPDLWVVHTREDIAFWWESKRQVGGELSPAQRDFHAECLRANVGCYHGDRYGAAQHLVMLGLAVEGDGPCGIEPAR